MEPEPHFLAGAGAVKKEAAVRSGSTSSSDLYLKKKKLNNHVINYLVPLSEVLEEHKKLSNRFCARAGARV